MTVFLGLEWQVASPHTRSRSVGCDSQNPGIYFVDSDALALKSMRLGELALRRLLPL
jgi:hypothetical protein